MPLGIVEPLVGRRRMQFEILNSIIETIPVAVVNHLSVFQGSSQMLFHYEDMLADILRRLGATVEKPIPPMDSRAPNPVVAFVTGLPA